MRKAATRARPARVNEAKRLRDLIKRTFPDGYGNKEFLSLAALIGMADIESNERQALADFLLELDVKIESLRLAVDPPRERDVRDGAIALSYLIRLELGSKPKCATYETAQAWNESESVVAKAITRCRVFAEARLTEYSRFWSGKLDRKAYHDGLRNVLKNMVD